MQRILITLILLCSTLSAIGQGYNSKGGSGRGYNNPYEQPQQESYWSGSGIAIGAKLIATNHHVVDGATNLSVYFPDSDKEYVAEVVTVDSEHDLAVVRVVDPAFSGFGSLKYGFKDEVEDVGMGVFVLGYPMVQTMGTEVKLTTGVVSSRSGFQGDKSQYQISAPVQPGNSGGPLFNDNGELIGIVSAKHAEAENVSYGVKLSHLCELASSVEGVNFNKASQISDLPLNEKCKVVIPCTVMVLANNVRSQRVAPEQPYSNAPKSSGQSAPKSGSKTGRSYPVRVNTPSVNDSNDSGLKIQGVELTEQYTALYLSLYNGYDYDGNFNVNEGIYVQDAATGRKYALISTQNCAVAPQYTSLASGASVSFTLYFEPVPASAGVLDMIEPGDNAWRIYGINL